MTGVVVGQMVVVLVEVAELQGESAKEKFTVHDSR